MDSIRRRFLVAAACLCLLGRMAAYPEEAGPDKAKVEALVKAMGSEKFEQREAAEKELLALGEPVLPALAEARKSPDPEISQRAARVHTRIRVRALLPKDTYARILAAGTTGMLAETPDGKTARENFRKTPLYRFWREPAVQAYFEAWKKKTPENERKRLQAMADIALSVSGPQAVFLGTAELKGEQEWAVPAVDFLQGKEDPQKFQAAVEAWRVLTGADIQKRIEIAGMSVDSLFDSFRLATDDMVWWGMTEPAIRSAIEGLVNPPKAPLAADEGFKAARAWAGNADLSAYATRQGLAELLVQTDVRGTDRDLINKLLTAHIASLAIALQMNEQGFHERWRLEVDRSKGLWKALSLPAKEDGALQAIPASAALVVDLRLDTGAAYAEAMAQLKGAMAEDRFKDFNDELMDKEEELGIKFKEVAGALKGGLLIASVPRPKANEEDEQDEFPLGTMVAGLLKDPKALLASLDKKTAGEDPALKKESLKTGFLYRPPEDRGEDGQPYIFVKDDVVVFAASKWVMDIAAAALAGEGARLSASEAFKQWRQGIPADAVFAAYCDTKAILSPFYAFFKDEIDIGDQQAVFPAVETFLKYLTPTSFVVRTTEKGFEAAASSCISWEGLYWTLLYAIEEGMW